MVEPKAEEGPVSHAPPHGAVVSAEGATAASWGKERRRRRLVGLLAWVLVAGAVVGIVLGVKGLGNGSGGGSSASAVPSTTSASSSSSTTSASNEPLLPSSVVSDLPGSIQAADYWYATDVVVGDGPTDGTAIVDAYNGESYTFAVKVKDPGTYSVDYSVAAARIANVSGINYDESVPLRIYLVGDGHCTSPARALVAEEYFTTESLKNFTTLTAKTGVSFASAGETAVTLCVSSGKLVSIASIDFTKTSGTAASAVTLEAPTTVVPGSVPAYSYIEYIDTPGFSSGPVDGAEGDVIDVNRGEEAVYQISVAKAGNFKVSYQLSSTAVSTELQLHLATGGSGCSDVNSAPISEPAFETSGGNYKTFTSTKPVKLAAGKQNVTVCFDVVNATTMAFHALSLAETSDAAPTPAPATVYPTADSKGCYESLVWESLGGEVLLNGEAFHIKGVSWSGFETDLYNVQGMWATTIPDVLHVLKSEGINALRVPVSLELALDSQTAMNTSSCVMADACASSGLAWDQLSDLIDSAAADGILIMLDMHTLSPAFGQSPVWYNGNYSETDFIAGWTNLLSEFAARPNLFAIDLFNEPHAKASWGIGVSDTDWGEAAARIVVALSKAVTEYKGLFFVEGVQIHAATPYVAADAYEYGHWWGGNFDGIYSAPITASSLGGSTALLNRVVLSPHQYGPSVYPTQEYFLDITFPENMPSVWELMLSFIKRVSSGRAVVLGEWGGSYVGKDKELQDALVDYLREICLVDAFWWVMNPNSGDTGGLLEDDWATPVEGKFAAMAKLQPKPSKFTTLEENKYCVRFGAYAREACNPAYATA